MNKISGEEELNTRKYVVFVTEHNLSANSSKYSVFFLVYTFFCQFLGNLACILHEYVAGLIFKNRCDFEPNAAWLNR